MPMKGKEAKKKKIGHGNALILIPDRKEAELGSESLRLGCRYNKALANSRVSPGSKTACCKSPSCRRFGQAIGHPLCSVTGWALPRKSIALAQML